MTEHRSKVTLLSLEPAKGVPIVTLLTIAREHPSRTSYDAADLDATPKTFTLVLRRGQKGCSKSHLSYLKAKQSSLMPSPHDES